MALIYASAVNRRMNALQKKNSLDFPASHQHHHHEIAPLHCKQRSNEERHLATGQHSRENSLNERKGASHHPAAASDNRGSPSVANGTAQNGNGSSTIHCQPAKRSSAEQPRPRRKMTVAGRPSEELPTALSGHRRKISTPAMAQSVAEMTTVTGGHKKSHNSPVGSPNNCVEQPATSSGSILASFGRAIRRRSVSADGLLFRARGGTSSSLDSSSGDNATGSPGPRKSSAFQKMKERLNRWKLSA